MRFLSAFFGVCVLLLSALQGEEILWLTWQRDPQTTMGIHWLTSLEEVEDHLHFRKVGLSEWQEVEGGHVEVPEGHPYLIHSLELIGLEPGQLYEIKKGSVVRKFQTAPSDLSQPLKFVAGGDIYHDSIERVEKMNRVAVALNPLFVVVGGDLAYSRHKLAQFKEDFDRWVVWLTSWSRTMVTADGRALPMVPVIGNHEVIGRGLQKPSNGKMFYLLFGLPEERGYRAIPFGDYLTLFLLDSNHTHKVSGEQTNWLKEQLKDSSKSCYKIASYHVPAYPAHRNYNTATCREIRQNWSPLFEAYSLTAAFEHHDHSYKRTHPIRKGEIDKKGVIYLGDGAWGVDQPRPHKPNWYLAKAFPLRHLFLVTLTPKKALFEGVSEEGEVFDSTERVIRRG